jgi:hypothetical protein
MSTAAFRRAKLSEAQRYAALVAVENEPQWFEEPGSRFGDYARDELRLVHMSSAAIADLRHADALVRAMFHAEDVLARLGEHEPVAEDREQRLEEARKRAEFAQQETERGFPLLHAHSLVGIWGALEVFVREMIVAWLLNVPEALASEELSNIKVPLALFERLSPPERMEALVDELDRHMHASLRAGVSRFEYLLKPLGLAGHVRSSRRRALHEMHQLRNAIVHARGIADRRLVEQCPQLGYRVGDPIRVTLEGYTEYYVQALYYELDILDRVRIALGLGLEEDVSDEHRAELSAYDDEARHAN